MSANDPAYCTDQLHANQTHMWSRNIHILFLKKLISLTVRHCKQETTSI